MPCWVLLWTHVGCMVYMLEHVSWRGRRGGTPAQNVATPKTKAMVGMQKEAKKPYSG